MVAKSASAIPPVAYGAHRFGKWGYINHEADDVSRWIQNKNSLIADSNAHWHGPQALCDEDSVLALVEEIELKQLCIERLGGYARTLPDEHQMAIFNIMSRGSR